MAYVTTGHFSHTAHNTGFVAGILRKVQQRRAFVQTRNELAALPDSALADLGLHRSQISEVAARTVYGKADL